jgi:hypothetical protein
MESLTHQARADLGDQTTIQGDGSIIGVVKSGYDRVMAVEIDPVLREPLRQLVMAIGRLSEVLPRSEALRAVYSYQSLLDEVLTEPPKAHIWEIACDFIRKVARPEFEGGQAVPSILDQLIPRLFHHFGPYCRAISWSRLWPAGN